MCLTSKKVERKIEFLNKNLGPDQIKFGTIKAPKEKKKDSSFERIIKRNRKNL